MVALVDSPHWEEISSSATYSCPYDDGAVDVAWFIYPTGPSVDVTVSPSGCAFASNGVRTVSGYTLGQRLTSLVGSPTR